MISPEQADLGRVLRHCTEDVRLYHGSNVFVQSVFGCRTSLFCNSFTSSVACTRELAMVAQEFTIVEWYFRVQLYGYILLLNWWNYSGDCVELELNYTTMTVRNRTFHQVQAERKGRRSSPTLVPLAVHIMRNIHGPAAQIYRSMSTTGVKCTVLRRDPLHTYPIKESYLDWTKGHATTGFLRKQLAEAAASGGEDLGCSPYKLDASEVTCSSINVPERQGHIQPQRRYAVRMASLLLNRGTTSRSR